MPDLDTIDSLLARLAAIPENIARLIENRDEEALRMRSSEDQWSVTEIFAHMRAVDDIFTTRIYAVLVRDHSQLVAYDERRWAEVARYAQIDFSTSLRLFTLCRAELVKVLSRVASADWQRIGVHEELGPLTLQAIVTSFVEHEEEHYEQMSL